MKIIRFVNADELDKLGYDVRELNVTDQHIDFFKNHLIENKIKIGGDEHQSGYIPVFDDGAILLYSYRAWGALMAEIWSEIDGREYNYMDFYMKCCIQK